MSKLLTSDVMDYIGRSEAPQKELVTRREIRKYSIATNQPEQKFLRGDVAPPMFHIALFWPVAELDELTSDGVYIDKRLPDFPLKKAMAGGWNIEYFKPIYPGDTLISTRTLTDVYEKQGSTGPLIFYELVTKIKDDAGQPVLTEKITRILR